MSRLWMGQAIHISNAAKEEGERESNEAGIEVSSFLEAIFLPLIEEVSL